MSKPDLYKESGVDIESGDELVDWLHEGSKKAITSNKTGQLLDGIGGFAGLFKPNFKNYEEPILVSSTDGVGTKLLLAMEQKFLSGVGIDLVAMCVNDLYCVGARPMFFLDYYATGVLDKAQFKDVLTGIKAGLAQCETPLLGGETAELPGLYEKGHFDLAGFVIGIVDYKKRLGAHLVKEGDLLYALPSSGFHSNGYSLIRKWLRDSPGDKTLVDQLLKPTTIYAMIPDLVDKLGINALHAVANITGGGISGNLPRVFPEHLCAHIDAEKIPTAKWMKDFILRNTSSLMDVEQVFNMGAGMIAIVANDAAKNFETSLAEYAIKPVCIGNMQAADEKNKGVVYL